MKDATIYELKGMVSKFRREAENYFPTPNTLFSLRFACTEVAEGMDAYLRMDGSFKRNSQKEHDVPQELAQCVLMLLTATPGIYETNNNKKTFTIDLIFCMVAEVLKNYTEGRLWAALCCETVLCIGDYLQNEYDASLKDELEIAIDKLKAKHELVHEPA